MSTDAVRADHDAPTTELTAGAVGDRCPNCQAALAPDQRYCVNCGERRGRPRFSPDTMAGQPVPAAAAGAAAPPPPLAPRSRLSSGTTLVAGIATLLIAMGVGVLIGHDSSNGTPARSPAAQVITVGGAGTGTAASAGNASNGASASSIRKASKSKGKVKVAHVVINAKVAKAASAAAAKVLGSSNNLSSNAQQQVGGSCTGGAGCQNGKFTGNFFPGG